MPCAVPKMNVSVGKPGAIQKKQRAAKTVSSIQLASLTQRQSGPGAGARRPSFGRDSSAKLIAAFSPPWRQTHLCGGFRAMKRSVESVPEKRHQGLPLLHLLVAEAEHLEPADPQIGVARAIVEKGLAAAVCLPAVRLDHQALPTPEEVGRVRPDADVHFRHRQFVAAAEAEDRGLEVAPRPVRGDLTEWQAEVLGVPDRAADVTGRGDAPKVVDHSCRSRDRNRMAPRYIARLKGPRAVDDESGT